MRHAYPGHFVRLDRRARPDSWACSDPRARLGRRARSSCRTCTCH